jgi:hypothetical protein
MKNKVPIFITALFLIGLVPLSAQSQRLTWVGDENAMRYEVLIEKEGEGEFNSLLREFTEETFIEVSLLSGRYRFQVIPYDFLNQPVPVTEWMYFEVISGSHEIVMVDDISSTEPEPEIESEPEKIIEDKKLLDIYLSAAWAPFFPVHTGSMGKTGESAAFSPVGVGARFGIVSARQRIFNPGMELTVSWCTSTMFFDCDLIQQFPFIEDRTAFKFHLGAGISLPGDGSSWTADYQSAHVNIGGSLLFLLPKNFFMETGVEYSQLFIKDFACFIRAWVGLGHRF